jgi:hypothetical protein
MPLVHLEGKFIIKGHYSRISRTHFSQEVQALFNRIPWMLRVALFIGLVLLLACGPAADPLPTTPAPDVPAANSPPPTAILTPGHNDASPLDPEPSSPAPPKVTATPTLSPEEEALRDELKKAGIVTAGWKTDFSKHSVPYSEIISGGPPRDGIPPLDDPQFVSVAEADQ